MGFIATLTQVCLQSEALDLIEHRRGTDAADSSGQVSGYSYGSQTALSRDKSQWPWCVD